MIKSQFTEYFNKKVFLFLPSHTHNPSETPCLSGFRGFGGEGWCEGWCEGVRVK